MLERRPNVQHESTYHGKSNCLTFPRSKLAGFAPGCLPLAVLSTRGKRDKANLRRMHDNTLTVLRLRRDRETTVVTSNYRYWPWLWSRVRGTKINIPVRQFTRLGSRSRCPVVCQSEEGIVAESERGNRARGLKETNKLQSVVLVY